jgi:hypothetical protein
MSLLRPFRAAAPQRAQNFRTACLSSYCRGVDAAPTPPFAHRSHVVLCPTTVPFDFSCCRRLSRRRHRRRRRRFHSSFSASGAAARRRRRRRHPRRRPMGGGQGLNSRAGGHPLLDALSIFCMSAAAVAAEKGAVQPQVPAVLFIISTANAELAVLSLPRVAILFLGGGNVGREGGAESDSATNSAGERLRSEPAGACGL